jgi:hypothetical protein
MRYFLDTEFNGFGGALISVGLAAEHGGDDYYVVLPLPEAIEPWVAQHVVPYLRSVPDMLYNQLDRVAAAHDIAAYLAADPDPTIIADWPEDIALFCRLMMPGATDVVDLPGLRFEYLRTPGFSTAATAAYRTTRSTTPARCAPSCSAGGTSLPRAGSASDHTHRDHRHRAPVLRIGAFVGARRHRPFLAIADHRQPRRIDAVGGQEVLGRVRATVAER